MYRSDGSSSDHLSGHFIHHPEHAHTHFEDYALYVLEALDVAVPVPVGSAKTSFCLVDTERVYGIASGLKPEGTTTEAYRQVLIDEAAAETPLGRIAQPEDVAQAAAYLASSESDFMTGLAINVSGAIPAVMLDIGWPPEAMKGIPLLARTAGLIAHLYEESQRSIGFIMSHAADQAISYDGEEAKR